VLEARFTSTDDSSRDVVWHFYTRGRLIELGTPISGGSAATLTPGEAARPELGPQAGITALPPQSPHSLRVTARFAKPGSEFVKFMAATSAGDEAYGNQHSVRAFQADSGLVLTSLQPEQALAGSTTTLVLSGEDFQAPLQIEFGDPAISASKVRLISSREVWIDVTIPGTAEPGTHDVVVTSQGRTFTFAEGFTTLWPPPVVTAVSPVLFSAKDTAAQQLHVTGDFFFAPSFVNLGSQMQVLSVQRLSRWELLVEAVPVAGSNGAVDLEVAGPGGKSRLPRAATIVP
jgi:hypothetical protein